ncbi:hypothetical protein PR202_ga21158 [Eleusine coracana subsp. coracana]|uniref:Uncharacterized protein n=1 Tax=Eleusine coracana subsp. coracana TaxID=191504 RepID=A0AAV5CZT3_ELECO|nr:hypothetical protein PR202_ga21158 [Eleusine coracana subsp. coracana]
MALQCAVELGIPTAVHRAGGAASLPDLLAAVPVPEHRKPYLPRLMRFLVVTAAALSEDNSRVVYRLTPLSRLLVDDDVAVNGCTSLAPFVLSQTTRFHVGAALRLSDWFKQGADDDSGGAPAAEMPFRMAHGTDPWDAMRRDPVVSKMFHDGLGADSRLALDFVVNQCGAVFDGVGSLVDVGGGDGSSARAIARAFPHVKCSVLDLPHVIGSVVVQQPSDGVEYIVGDMMSFIPPSDAVLLKVCCSTCHQHPSLPVNSE